MTESHEIIVRLYSRDYYIIETLQKEGLSLDDIFMRAKKIIRFISEEQKGSEEVVISEETINGVSRTALVFGGQINLNLKYSNKIGLWSLLRSAFKIGATGIQLRYDEAGYSDLDRLTRQYKLNSIRHREEGILNIGLRIYWEMHCGAKYGSIFKINNVEVKGII